MRILTTSICLLVSLLAGCGREAAINVEELAGRARSGDRAAIAQLVDLLAVTETKVGEQAYPAVVAAGKAAVPVLMSKVESRNRQQREYVIAALGTLKADEAVPVISGILADRTLERRYVAAWALGEIGQPQGIPALLAALDDPNSEVRRYATRALIKVNRPALEPLISFLGTAQGEAAAGAIRALGDIADPAALETLLAHMAGPQRAEACLALGKLRDPRAETALLHSLQDTDWRVRMNAAMALGPLGSTAAEGALRRSLDDEVHVVREWSARSLEMVSGKPVLYRNSKGEMVRPYNVYH